MLQLVLELNRKFGYGYQVRIIHPPVNSVKDDEPYNLYEAGAGAGAALEAFNESMRTDYEIHNVLSITDEAIQANKTRDLATAKLAKELQAGDYTNIVPRQTQNPMARKKVIDGEEEVVFTMRGTALVTYLSWFDDKVPRATQFLREYCKILASRKYGGSANKIFADLERMSKDDGATWIDKTFVQYMYDDDVMNIFQNVMGKSS